MIIYVLSKDRRLRKSFDVADDSAVHELMSLLGVQGNQNSRLVFDGREMGPSSRLTDFGITQFSKIFLL
jgi:hypothetical protein